MESYLQKRAQLLRNYLLDNYLISVADHEDFWDFYLFFSDKKVGFQFSIARRLTSASLELEGRKYAFNRHLRLLAHNQLLPAMADKLSRWLDLKNPGDGLDHLFLTEDRFKLHVEKELNRLYPYNWTKVIIKVCECFELLVGCYIVLSCIYLL